MIKQKIKQIIKDMSILYEGLTKKFSRDKVILSNNMARITKVITFSLPPKMVKKIEELKKKEGRTRSELLREALRRYIEDQEWKKILRYGRMQAKKKSISEEQVEDIVDEYRK